MTFTKRKFLQLDLSRQHKKCAELLREYYDRLLQNESCSFEIYQQWLSWMKQLPFELISCQSVADRYHWHLTQAGQSLKEHNLLPCNPYRKIGWPAQASFQSPSISTTCAPLIMWVAFFVLARPCASDTIYFSQHMPDHEHEKVVRTAMGAASLVPCFRNVLLNDLPRPIIALDTSDEAIFLNDFIFPASFTLVLGNEEYGISDDALRLADILVEIPLFGVKNSLNVACAFAIAGAQIRQQFSI